jgi:single-stranded DNA-binding protein
MGPLGVNKTVLLGVLSRSPQLHYGREGSVRALLSLTTRVLPIGAHGEIPGASLEDAHLVYCEGGLVQRLTDLPSGALVYLEGRNREQRMTDPSGKSHRLAYVSASIVRHLNSTPTTEGANSATLVGTVMRDPIRKPATGGQSESVKLRLMTTHRHHDDSSQAPKYNREYHWVTFYGRVAEFVATRAQEGNLVYIEGRNQPSRWQDAEGLNHRTITVVGHYFQLLHTEPKLKAPAPNNIEAVTHGWDVQLPDEEASFSM